MDSPFAPLTAQLYDFKLLSSEYDDLQDSQIMSTVKVNQASSGTQDTDRYVYGSWSPDGTKVVFAGDSNIYVAGDTNNTTDVFVKDLISGAITRVSTASDGAQANDYSYGYGFSPDGGSVLFYSYASNLVPGDTNKSNTPILNSSGSDIFIKNLATNETTRISTSADGTEANRDHDLDDVIFSPTGQQVAFESYATNLVPGDTNGVSDIFIKTVSGPNAGAIIRASTAADGKQSNGFSWGQSFSADGSKLLFTSEASNLVSGDTNQARDAFVKDLVTGGIERVSTGSNGAQIASGARGRSLSPDGSKVLFDSSEKNLVPGFDNGAKNNVYLKDLKSGQVDVISTNPSNSQYETYNSRGSFSPDGAKIYFTSYDYDPVKQSETSKIFINDLATGELGDLKVNLPSKKAGEDIDIVDISLDGKKVLYTVDPTNFNSSPSESFGLYATDEVSCYASGTLIETSLGPVAVEALRIGDHVRTASGDLRPIRWIGHREIDCARHPRPEAVWPVRVQADAFGAGLPSADLWLSPDHAVRVTVMDEVLIPIKHLVNGATVAQVARDTVTYWHVELDSHDILVANGLPAESFLDTGVRACFANGAEHSVLHPDFTPLTLDDFCRPLIQGGPIVDAVRQRLAARAFGLGWTTTAEPDLAAWVDGVRLRPEMDGPMAVFEIPAEAETVRITSRSFVPEHTDPACRDGRRLGVPVRHIGVADATDITRTLPIASDLLCEGFHFVEGDATDPWRWTDGTACLPAALWAGCRGPVRLRITTAPDRGTLRAWVPPAGIVQAETEAEKDCRSA